MVLTGQLQRADRRPERQLDVEIVVPVFNEERNLEPSIRRLRRYLDDHLPFRVLVTIADNASTDATSKIASRLSRELALVRAVRIEEKGRGRALRTAWLQSTAAVVAYMDVDLSTDLDALFPLVAPLLSGHSEIAIGTRLAPGARVIRGPRRELISRAYNLLVRALLGTQFSDAQCGFKAVSREVAQVMLPLVADNGWFFDTELLVLAQRNGLRIHEVAVDWVEGRDSTVQIASTAREDIKGIFRLLRVFTTGGGWADLPPRCRRVEVGQFRRTAGIGMASTLAYLLLFVALRSPLGALGANAAALGTTSVLNTAVHMGLARRGRSGGDPTRSLSGAAIATLASLTLTTAALCVAELVASTTENDLIAITLATLAATPLRLLAVRAAVNPLATTGTGPKGHRS